MKPFEKLHHVWGQGSIHRGPSARRVALYKERSLELHWTTLMHLAEKGKHDAGGKSLGPSERKVQRLGGRAFTPVFFQWLSWSWSPHFYYQDFYWFTLISLFFFSIAVHCPRITLTTLGPMLHQGLVAVNRNLHAAPSWMEVSRGCSGPAGSRATCGSGAHLSQQIGFLIGMSHKK